MKLEGFFFGRHGLGVGFAIVGGRHLEWLVLVLFPLI